MKVTCSPLVAALSGRAADAVAGSWKGILYVRKHVVPHNPKSAGQVTQRRYMARMSPWFRSLPEKVTDWLDDLAVGLGNSGYNLMVAEDLKHLAAAEVPEIVPANAKCNALFSVADATGGPNKLDVTWVAGNAVGGHFVYIFTCPVDPDEVAKTEPDGWTRRPGGAPNVFDAAQAAIAVSNAAKDYYVACLVGDTADFAAATIISGGIGQTCTSGA